MASTANWNPAEFDYWYKRLPLDERKRRAWDGLSGDQKKRYTEWWTFGKFASASSLDIDPRTIESREPPESDIHCCVSGKGNYFELGEVTDQTLARNGGKAAKQQQDVHAGSFAQLEPLSRIVEQKCSKRYTTHGQPLHLLLHYSVGHQVPHTALVRSEMAKVQREIVLKLRKSPFSNLWLFDGWDQCIIGHVEW